MREKGITVLDIVDFWRAKNIEMGIDPDSYYWGEIDPDKLPGFCAIHEDTQKRREELEDKFFLAVLGNY